MNERALRQPALSLRYAFLIGVAAAVITLDQISKAVVTSELQGRAPAELLGGAIRLTYAQNTGAAFSVLPAGGIVFETVAVLVSLGILVAYPRLSHGSLLVRTALGLVLGGAIGNLVDRIRLGYVVDFVDLRWWPVFNLADSAIVIGVGLLLLHSMLDSQRSKQ